MIQVQLLNWFRIIEEGAVIKQMMGPYSEKAMAPHSSTLAWKIPWAEEPGGLPSLESHRVDTNEET